MSVFVTFRKICFVDFISRGFAERTFSSEPSCPLCLCGEFCLIHLGLTLHGAGGHALDEAALH
jgi:hypothetical protein